MLSEKIPLIFPAHPRTIRQIKDFRLVRMIQTEENISPGNSSPLKRKPLVIPPLGYLDFLCLMSKAALVMTDSGGIQEETTILGIPCLTLRNNTERPITVTDGTNVLVGNNPQKITKTALRILRQGTAGKRVPELWDGKVAGRIVRILLKSCK
jgi:UDP-N-acetylglucosamine 2-epimerase (non-hydrolysing)